jgi:hypothetical protein
LIESTLQLGNLLIEKIEDFKHKSQNPALLGGLGNNQVSRVFKNRVFIEMILNI